MDIILGSVLDLNESLSGPLSDELNYALDQEFYFPNWTIISIAYLLPFDFAILTLIVSQLIKHSKLQIFLCPNGVFCPKEYAFFIEIGVYYDVQNNIEKDFVELKYNSTFSIFITSEQRIIKNSLKPVHPLSIYVSSDLNSLIGREDDTLLVWGFKGAILRDLRNYLKADLEFHYNKESLFYPNVRAIKTIKWVAVNEFKPVKAVDYPYADLVAIEVPMQHNRNKNQVAALFYQTFRVICIVPQTGFSYWQDTTMGIYEILLCISFLVFITLTVTSMRVLDPRVRPFDVICRMFAGCLGQEHFGNPTSMSNGIILVMFFFFAYINYVMESALVISILTTDNSKMYKTLAMVKKSTVPLYVSQVDVGLYPNLTGNIRELLGDYEVRANTEILDMLYNTEKEIMVIVSDKIADSLVMDLKVRRNNTISYLVPERFGMSLQSYLIRDGSEYNGKLNQFFTCLTESGLLNIYKTWCKFVMEAQYYHRYTFEDKMRKLISWVSMKRLIIGYCLMVMFCGMIFLGEILIHIFKRN